VVAGDLLLLLQKVRGTPCLAESLVSDDLNPEIDGLCASTSDPSSVLLQILKQYQTVKKLIGRGSPSTIQGLLPILKERSSRSSSRGLIKSLFPRQNFTVRDAVGPGQFRWLLGTGPTGGDS